jgi:hypothetical protein
MKSVHISILAAAMAVAGATAAIAQTAAPTQQATPAQAPAPDAAPYGAGQGKRGQACPEHQRRHAAYRSKHGRFMGRMDADRDGQISRDELLAAQQRQLEMFDRADTDHDGKVTREERHAMRESLREQHRQRRQGVSPGTSSGPDPEIYRES